MRWSHSRFYRRSFQTDYKMTISILSYMPVSASDNTFCVVPQLICSQHSNSTVLLSTIPISMTSLQWTSRRSKTSSVLGKPSKLRKSMRSTTLTPTPLKYVVSVSRWQWSQAEKHRFQPRRQKFVSSYSEVRGDHFGASCSKERTYTYKVCHRVSSTLTSHHHGRCCRLIGFIFSLGDWLIWCDDCVSTGKQYVLSQFEILVLRVWDLCLVSLVCKKIQLLARHDPLRLHEETWREWPHHSWQVSSLAYVEWSPFGKRFLSNSTTPTFANFFSQHPSTWRNQFGASRSLKHSGSPSRILGALHFWC